jgi:hypothetical protein
MNKKIFGKCNKKLNINLQKGAALLITLLIISIVGGTVLVLGREILATTTSTNRYADAQVAESAAWAGIEDGLTKVKSSYPPSDNIDWTANIPILNLDDPNHYNLIVRRNVTEQTAAKGELAGDPNGINYEDPNISSIAESCDNAAKCTASKWDNSDTYYDLRVSGTDYTIGVDGLDAINLDPSNNIIDKSGYYMVSRARQGELNLTYIDKIFDLSNYRGTTGNNKHQKIVMYYQYLTDIPLSSLVAEIFVKYDTSMDSCYSTCPSINEEACPGGGRPHGTIYTYRYRLPAGPAAPSPSSRYIYIPWACGGSITDHVQYLGIRFRFAGCAGCKVAFGIRESSNPCPDPCPTDPPDPDDYWVPYGGSYIGTGVARILSTGIYGNVRKTIEVWAEKLIHNPNINTGGDLECIGSAGMTTLSNCKINIYRVIK